MLYKQTDKQTINKTKMKNLAKKKDSINSQIDSLQNELNMKRQKLYELSRSGMNYCSGYYQLYRDCMDINTKIGNLITELYK